MALVANTAHNFNFAVEIDGLPQGLVQKFTPPKLSMSNIEHGDTNYDVGTPGKRKTDDATIEKIRPGDGADNWAYSWFNAANDPFTGRGALAGNLKRVVVVRELDASGLIVLRTWVMEGCYITEYETSDYDKTGDGENIIETITLHVDRARII